MSGRLNLALTALLVICAQSQARQLDIEWAQLQLDQSTLGKNARIETNARRDLHMQALTAARTQYLTVGAK